MKYTVKDYLMGLAVVLCVIATALAEGMLV